MNFSFNKNPSNPLLYLDDCPLQNCSKVRFLGVIIDDQLKFGDHLDVICSKISKTIGILYRIRNNAPERVLLQLYYSLVFPYLLYCIEVWGSTYLTHLKPL